MPRRSLATALLAGALTAACAPSAEPPGGAAPSSSLALAPGAPAIADWTRTARIGGAAVWVGMTSAEVSSLVNKMVSQHVNVIEADGDLSNYLTDAELADQLALMRQLATAAHAKGLRIVFYYPTLEVLTPNGFNIARTMYKDHPDWVQLGLNGQPNVFYGGQGRVFWVDPDMESAWMSVETPYRAYFLDRVRQIAATGVDGLWGDVPLLNDIGVTWADTNPVARAKFKADTGYDIPAAVSWTDPAWRRWIAWRHAEIADFLRDVRDAGRAVTPGFTFIVETVTMDYNAATSIALDGTDLQPLDGVTHVWEIDALSDNTAMRRARPDDWACLIAMNKFSRAASGEKPAWVFTYGKQANDAELVMAEALAAGNNPYETKIPEMTTTVGAAYRTRMFGFIEANEPFIYGTTSGARVGLWYSPPSRDYVDQAKGLGLYATTTSSDALWWSTDKIDSVYQRQWLAEFRGFVKLLAQTHVPFDVLVRPDLARLSRYEAVVLPDVEALSAADAAALAAYVQGGGHLVVTGPNPSGLDELGGALPDYALAGVLGFHKPAAPPAQGEHAYGAGKALVYAGLLGKAFMVSSDAAAKATLGAALAASATPPLTTTADPKVHLELTRTAGALVLQLVNYLGVTGTFAVVPTTAGVTLALPAGATAAKVELASPDNATPALAPLAFSQAPGTVSFDAPVVEYALVVVTLSIGPPPPNQPPVAAADALATAQDTPLAFTAAQLLANDTDPDGDPLTVTSVDAASAAGGAITGGGGSYTYAPPAGFTGSDTFGYAISDGRGGAATGSVTVTVSAPAANRPPVAANDALATALNTPLAFTAAQLLANDTDPDGDPLTVTSVDAASAAGGAVTGSGGSYTYAPPAGFTGSDTFGYAISDGRGGAASATVTVTVSGGFTAQTVYPKTVTITTGKYDWGTMASFTASDGNTYDVLAGAVTGGTATDWYGSAALAGSPAGATSVTVTYSGQYSMTGVSQQLSLYDWSASAWVLFDTRTVGNTNDVTVTLSGAASRFVSPAGELRARVRGTRASGNFYCWANLLRFKVQ